MSYQLQAPPALSPGEEPSLPIGQEAGMRQILWSTAPTVGAVWGMWSLLVKAVSFCLFVCG